MSKTKQNGKKGIINIGYINFKDFYDNAETSDKARSAESIIGANNYNLFKKSNKVINNYTILFSTLHKVNIYYPFFNSRNSIIMCNYSIVFTTGNKCNNTFSGIKIVDYKFSKELLSKDIGESIIKSKEGEITQLSKLVTKKKMNDGKLLTIIMYLMPEGWVGKDATKQVFSNNYITQAFND